MNWIKVEIVNTKGSTPRETGASMWVSESGIEGSIGGGALEFQAIEKSRLMLAQGEERANVTITLGPKSGQCCGGVVELRFEAGDYAEKARRKLAIFGAGHIGTRLFIMSRAFPFDPVLYDTRTKIETDLGLANHPACPPYERVAIPEAVIDTLSSSSIVLIMTHDHALDFLIAERALLRDDLAYVGMIGSKSKAARFFRQYKSLGPQLARLRSPIGQAQGKEGGDKRPEMIALAILSEIALL